MCYRWRISHRALRYGKTCIDRERYELRDNVASMSDERRKPMPRRWFGQVMKRYADRAASTDAMVLSRICPPSRSIHNFCALLK